jgi:hypothetical protein
MAAFNGNSCYLSIDGVPVVAHYKSVSITPNIADIDTTRGNTDWEQANAGLKRNDLDIQIGYDDALEATLIPLARVGTHTVIYGPRGNTAGRPKHEQSFLFTKSGYEQTAEKGELVWKITGRSVAAPATDIEAGGTF